MILFKHDDGPEQAERLRRELYDPRFCPYLMWKVSMLNNYAETELGLNLLITRVFGEDSEAHNDWRAVDGRVVVPRFGLEIMSARAFEILKSYHDSFLKRFGTYDSLIRHEVKGKGGKSRGDHWHMQRPKGLVINVEPV